VLVWIALGALASVALRASEDRTDRAAREALAAVEARVAHSAEFLSSDALEGRGAGSKGLDAAADFIAEQFEQTGLDTTACGGTPFQTFTATLGSRLGPDNTLVFRGPLAEGNGEEGGPREIEPAVGQDFSPLAMSASGGFDLPLVFVGYGISAPKLGYDDYQGVDVKGKAVIILRHEPQQDDAESPFNGKKDSPFAALSRKLANAAEHEAAAVIFCTDSFEIEQELAEARKQWLNALESLEQQYEQLKQLDKPTPDQLDEQRRELDRRLAEVQRWSDRIEQSFDPLLPFRYGGRGGRQRELPVIHCRRQLIDRVLQAAAGTDLATLEEQIDHGLTPQSRELGGWHASGRVDLQRVEVEMRNVVAVLEGAGPKPEQTIVLGAHYDHLGRSSSGRPDPSSSSEAPICNGADDNASGVAVMLEVAHLLATRAEKPPRRVVFVAFAGEESGLLGSAHYVSHPVVPLDQTIAMLNLDMVGRMRDEKLMVLGSQSGRQFGELLERINRRHGLNVANVAARAGASDQVPFYSRKVPVMHFFTGLHEDYHRPSDDFEKLNLTGMARVAQFVEEVVVALAEMPEPPDFVQLSPPKRGGGGNRAYLGTVPDFGARDAKGYAIAGVAPDGPADKAGLQAGDVLVRFGESRIGGLDDMQSALEKHTPGQRVSVVVLRDGEEKTFEVTLGERR